MNISVRSSRNSFQTQALEMKLGQKKAEFQRLKGDNSIDMSEKKKKAGVYLREIRQLESQQIKVDTASPKVANDTEKMESGSLNQTMYKTEEKLHEMPKFEARA